MQTYRFFFITVAGRIVTAEVAECIDDAAARAKGRRLLAARPAIHAIEIWDKARLVATVTHDVGGTGG